jgi:hypothetical protein
MAGQIVGNYIVIEGHVVGGHTIEDLAITVPYHEEITLPADRASWSRDLNYALQHGLVVKKRVVTARDLTTMSRTRIPAIPKDAPVKRPRHTTKGPSETSKNQPSGLNEISEIVMEENSKLREMNAVLIEATRELVEQQKTLTKQLSEYMKQGPVVVHHHGKTGSTDFAVVSEDDDVPTFIPSKISNKNLKVSDNNEVKKGKAESSDLDSSMAALKNMRKGKKDG